MEKAFTGVGAYTCQLMLSQKSHFPQTSPISLLILQGFQHKYLRYLGDLREMKFYSVAIV